ncbi:MAG: PQQ-dependent sugar dehydrogenase [Phycisphaerales bacterium]|nr:PQQ-dependent sugar dehydrogenase [Phycisphaerales bacterium]
MLKARICAWAALWVVGIAAVANAETVWTVREGTTQVAFEAGRLAELGLTVSADGGARSGIATTHLSLAIDAASDLEVVDNGGIPAEFSIGALVHANGLTISSAAASVTLDGFAIAPQGDGPALRVPAHRSDATGASLLLGDVKVGFDRVARAIYIESAQLVISGELANALGNPELTGEAIGSLRVSATLTWVGGDTQEIVRTKDKVTRAAVACGGSSGADVIVGNLLDVTNYTSVNGIEAFAVGTTSCNVGDTDLNWVELSNDHPVIAQNMYRLKDGRFEQLGQSWLKHGFFALTENYCGCGCNGHGGSVLGVGCSDPYCCGLNGSQDGLGPKFEVNPSTGVYPYPPTDLHATGNTVYKRLQVAISDLDPAQDGGGQYFVEGHYVAKDDAAAGNQANNASYRPVTVFGAGSSWSISLAGVTAQEQCGIRAWQDNDPSVDEVDVMIPTDGLVIVAGKASDAGNGFWHYEYAVQNLYSDRAIGSFTVPVKPGSTVTNIGFHDVAYHSGEPFDGTDWPGAHVGDTVTWSTTDYATDPDANALRWGTLYNFRFDINRAPSTVDVELGMFKPGTPDSVAANIVGPALDLIDCNSNGIDDLDDITNGDSDDCNANGTPDECEAFAPTALRVALVASGLNSAVSLAAPPDDYNRLFVCEQNTGRVRIIKNGVLLETPFLDIGALASSGGERGLLSIAFHPDYANNGYFFVDYTDNSGDTVIARYSVTIDPDLADPTSAVILKTIVQEAANHNGGQLQFGPDGYLYVGMGDGGSFDDPFNRAQDPQYLLGKILRLDVDAGAPWIPASNPFVGDGSTLDEIWTLGMRNPWRFSFDRETGDLYIGDVGQNTREEIDFQPAGSPGGENYGWDCEEGFIATPTNNGGYGCTAGDPTLVDPILDVDHSDAGSCSIIAGYVYRGCTMPELKGTFFFSDYCGGYVRTFRYANGDAVPPVVTDRSSEFTGISGAIVSFGEDAAGELYIVTLAGNVYKIVPDNGPACGDYLVESGEECDDGNAQSGDGCSATCQLETICGNNIVEVGETCDPPDGLTCDTSCQDIACGVTAFADDFETDMGWTVVNENLSAGNPGAWERGTPAGLGDRSDPTDDYNGGGQCYLTENGAGNTDVDGGPTRLISPVLDLSAGGVTLSYAYWFAGTTVDGTDHLQVEVSVNGGTNWTEVAVYDTPIEQWLTDSIVLDDFVTPSATTQVRFNIQDNPNNSVIEGGIDAVRFIVPCPDCNSNGIADDAEIAGGTSPDCDSNGLPDDCDIADGAADCDGGPVGSVAGGAAIVQSICFGCHNVNGTGGPGFPGPNIRNHSRAFIWNKLQNPAANHPGGLFPQFTQQDFADIEAYLADNGSRGRPDLIPDVCQVLADCDSDEMSDGCELEAQTQTDLDYDGFPDECILCTTTPGDGDGDCDADLRDYAKLQECYTGDGSAYAVGCECFDADHDGDIDDGDFTLLQSAWSEPGASAGGCTPIP